MSTHDLRGAINSAVDTTPVDQLLARLGYALGQIEAKALIASTRVPETAVMADRHVAALAAAMREIRDIARNATTAKPAEPTPAGVAGYPIGTRHAGVVAVQQPGRGAF